jgi:pimeloyl-ACP methyl ester carboxylesterase
MTGEGDYKEGAPQDGIVEHLMALVEHLGLKRVVIVGSSFGANVAVHLFWRIHSRTDGLVLVGCGPALNRVETLCTSNHLRTASRRWLIRHSIPAVGG